jgi:hypothetical protein
MTIIAATIIFFYCDDIHHVLPVPLRHWQEDGNNICPDDFGTFSISAGTIRPAQQEREIRAESIHMFKTS